MLFPNDLKQSVVATPLGEMVLAASSDGLAGAWFCQNQLHCPAHEVMQQWPIARREDGCKPLLDKASRQINQYFLGARKHFDLPLDLSSGTPFQQSVWRQLQAIEYGRTSYYGAVSLAVGRAQAARAVGSAIARNPLSLIIPCHRVLRASGDLGGYAGGLARKQALLALESSNSSGRADGRAPMMPRPI